MKIRKFTKSRRVILFVLIAVLLALVLTAATSQAAPEQSCGFYHYVKYGQTLSSISRYYGVPVNALLQANPHIKNPDVIYAGSKVFIPCKGGTGGPCSHVHYVRHGDTLSAIARYYHVHPYAIMRANNIHNPNLIYAGSSLCIP